VASSALKHIRNYASAGVLAALAGIITFPLLTRNLSVAEYGILGLITSSLTLFVAIGKLGMQHAVIRFYSQIKNKNLGFDLQQMNSTVSLVFFVFASVTAALWLFAGFQFLPRLSEFENISGLFFIASGIVFLRLLGSGIMNFLRAQQRSAVVGSTQILTRYLYLAIVLAIMISGQVNVAFVLLAMVVAEVIGVAFAAKKYWPDFHFNWSQVSAPLAKAMLHYGFPLMILESLGLVMRLSDRYIIQGLLGENELGMYSASYNLTAYLDLILLAALVQAVKPYYMQLWEGEGADRTKAFLSKGLHTYLVFGLPVIALFSLVSPHLLNFLASPKYSPGTIIIPFVAFSFLLDGAILFLSAGLHIKKNTKALMFWGGVATVMNLALNFLVVPVYGILGAAAVTIVSYLVFMLGVSYRAFEFLSFEIKVRVPLLSAVWSLMVYALLFKLDFGGDFTSLFIKGVLGSVLLITGIVLIDARAREWVVDRLRQPNAGAVK